VGELRDVYEQKNKMVYSASMHAFLNARCKRQSTLDAISTKKDQKIKTRSRSDVACSISHCRPTDAEPEIFHTRDPALAERCRVATKEEIKRGMR
jgi:hypothetical protein